MISTGHMGATFIAFTKFFPPFSNMLNPDGEAEAVAAREEGDPQGDGRDGKPFFTGYKIFLKPA